MKKMWLTLIFITSSFVSIYSHPHVYIDMEMILQTDEIGVCGIRQKWTPLYQFSSDLISEYDVDQNGVFDRTEQQEIYHNAFLGIASSYFFTYISIDGKDYASTFIENFSAEIEGDHVVFSFDLPARICADDKWKSIELVTYDPSTYVSFGFLGIVDNYHENLEYKIELVRDGAIYSHRNELGQLRALIDLRLSTTGNESSSQINPESSLIPLSELPPIPEDIVSNPFLQPGVWLESDRQTNPFLSNS